MKKLLLSMILLCAGLSASARKSYINFYAWDYEVAYPSSATLSGDLPEGFKNYYNYNELPDGIGGMLNQLAAHGYEVEFVSAIGHTGSKQRTGICFLLSKTIVDDPQPDPETPTTKVKADKEVKEIARYNLQGLPVKESDKGLQIIVYSNYTTKTVFVE